MNSLKKILKLGSLVLVASLILVGAVSYSLKNKKAENAFAGTGENVTGFAWSENIGWISFNNTSGGGGTNYGVNILEDASGVGKLSGFAWSENIGWISFNRSNTGAPPNNDIGATYGVLAYIDSNNKLQGWARALTACDNSVPADGDCVDAGEGSGPGTNSGGWDGWIRLNDNNKYGITLTPAAGTSSFSGWAWGSDNIGWISFNCLNRGVCSSPTAEGGPSDYKVFTNFELNLAPSVVANNISTDYCNGRITFNWTFSDLNISGNLNQQRGWEIKAAYDPDVPSIIIASSSTGSANSTTVLLNDLTTKIGSPWYDKKLKWQITVWDNAINGSGNQPKSATNTRIESSKLSDREYPVVNFDSNPTLDKIYAEQDVQFLDKSTCYSFGNTPAANCSSWSWDIPNAVYQQGTSASQNPIVQFAESVQNKIITLIARDEKGNSCSASKTINIGLPIPKIEEKK